MNKELAFKVLKWILHFVFIVLTLYIILFVCSVIEVFCRHVCLLIRNYLKVGEHKNSNHPQGRGSNTPYGGVF